MKDKIILTILVSIGIGCVVASLITQSLQTIVLSKAIGVIILLVSIKKINESASINLHEK